MEAKNSYVEALHDKNQFYFYKIFYEIQYNRVTNEFKSQTVAVFDTHLVKQPYCNI